MLPVRNVGLSLVEQAATGPPPEWEFVADTAPVALDKGLRPRQRDNLCFMERSDAEEIVLNSLCSLRGVLLNQVHPDRIESVARSSSLPWRLCICWTTGER